MRFLKWISVLTILALLCAMLPATVAEDEIVIDAEETVEGELEIEIDDLEELDDFVDPVLSLDDAGLDLDGLEDNLLTAEIEEQTEAPTAAVANASSDFEIDDDGVLIRYGGFEKNVVIPDGIKKIGREAFLNYTNLESVIIPNSVTGIEGFIYGAFQGCTGLKSITLPNSITGIGSWAFEGCTALTNVTLPNQLEYIGYRTFANCTSLKSIVIPNTVNSIDSGIFSGCSSLSNIQLPTNMIDIQSGMFSGCDSIKDLKFLASIATIGDHAFSDCDGLTDVTIPGSVTSIKHYAFENCKNLESIVIPSEVSFIDRTAFNGSNNVVIRGTAGTYAESFANGVGIPFNAPVITFNEESKYDGDNNIEYIYLYINQSRTLNAVQKPADLARTLAWSSSDTSVVTVDQSGKIKGISQGEAIITAATADGKGKTAQIKVVVPEPTSIKINYDAPWYYESNTVILNQTSTISADKSIPYKNETGVEMPITWSSSDNSIISVEATEDNKATLKGNALGKATITATTPDGGKASLELEVVRPYIEGIKIDQSGPIKLYPGQKYNLTASVTPSEANPNLTWTSDDTTVAAVNQSGVITANKPGYTEIFVNANDGYSSDNDSILVQVLTAPKKVTLNKTKATLGVGDTLTLKATLSPSAAKTGFTWSSSKPSVAKVSKKGKVTALKVGTAKITVTTTNGKTAKATITVKAAPKKVKLSKTKATLGVKEKLTLKATFSPSSAYSTLTWKSSKPAVASVSSKGVVTPKRTGTAVISVRTKNGKTAKATITVKAAPKTVTLNKTGEVTLAKGKKLKLKATLPADTASALTWKSSNPKVAAVDKNGMVTAKKAGTAVITVTTFNGKTAKVTVRVK